MKKISFLFSMILLISTLSFNAQAEETNFGPDDPPQVATQMMVAVRNIVGVTVTEVHLEITKADGSISYYSAPYSGELYTAVTIPGPATGVIKPSVIAFPDPGFEVNYTVTNYVGSWPVPNYANKMSVTFF